MTRSAPHSVRSRCAAAVLAFGGWPQAQATHFADGGEFDRIYQPGAR